MVKRVILPFEALKGLNGACRRCYGHLYCIVEIHLQGSDRMNREEAKNYIQSRVKDFLQPDRCGKGYVCPICGSGTGKNGTGITTRDGIHFTCWAGCFSNSDIIDIIGLKDGITDYNGKLRAAAKDFNITIDGEKQTAEGNLSSMRRTVNGNTQINIHNSIYTNTQQEEAEQDYRAFFKQANQHITETDYHRGITLETLNRFHVGYVASWKHPKAPKMKASPRLIIPTSDHSYLARHASQSNYINYKGVAENKSKVGGVRIFNTAAFREAQQPIFIVEGEIDAMSIVDVGGEAIGLGSIGNVNRLLSLLKGKRVKQPLVIALDNETDLKIRERVAKAEKQLIEGLEQLGIEYYQENITGQYKDANEALVADRAAFTATINQVCNRIEIMEAEALEAEKDALKQESVTYSLQNFRQTIEDSKTEAFYPTGFFSLDELLDGGLYAGLYFVGAISSLGKTTFCLQIADTIAASGKDVIIFSLEMARNELIAKSISRLTYTKTIEKQVDIKNAKTTRGIMTGARYSSYSKTERELIEDAITAYGEYGRHLYITEGVGNVGVEAIKDKIKKHIKLTGEAPVVLIDYLQIIAPADPRATDKQNTDRAVLELKRLSRDYHIPVIGISSFNRDNYTAPVNLTSFKESGAIEYSSDVLIGIQYDGMDYQEGESEKNRDKRIRELVKSQIAAGKEGKAQRLQVKVLKNRNGCKGESIINFYPMFNYFAEPAIDDYSITIGGDEWEEVNSDYGNKSVNGPKQAKKTSERQKEKC